MTENCGWNEVYWTIDGRQCAMYQFVKLNGDGFGVFDRRSPMDYLSRHALGEPFGNRFSGTNRDKRGRT